MHLGAEPDPAENNPDRKALALVGQKVRERLDADPGAWKAPTELADIYGFTDFLSGAECDRMIELIDATAKPSALYDHGNSIAGRTSYSGDVDRSNPFVRMIERRIDDCLGLPNEWGETVQGQRYQPGQEFKDHTDWFRTWADYWPDESSRGGQRSWTAMIYLTDVEEGGETRFPKLSMDIPPQRGVMFAWNNAKADGTPNIDTLHAGLPVVRGTKYIITKWYRTRPWG